MRLLLHLCLTLLLAAPASAVIHDLEDGSANTTPPASDPGFDHVGDVAGLSAVYMGNGWVLTAAHVATGNVVFGGTSYPPLLHSRVELQPEGTATLPPDLALWRLRLPWPALPVLPIRNSPAGFGEAVVMIGNGASRLGTTSWMGVPGYSWGGSHDERWGTNLIDGFPSPDPYVDLNFRHTHAFNSRFDCICMEDGTTEAAAVNGDSGGAVFIEDGGVWRLAGIMFARGTFLGQPANTVLAGNLTWIADLSVYRAQILAITAPTIPALPVWGVPLLGGLLAASAARLLRHRASG